MQQQQTIYTITANCQDCYRCVRECPVKAIRIYNGQAQVEDNLCIKCGTCVRECPQHAKTVRSDLEEAKALMASGKIIAASVAPSFAAMFPGALSKRIPSALRQLGFKYVSETAEGAKYVTEQSFAESQKGSICTACPAFVNLVEKYHSEYLDALIPVVSPMIAHGRILKEQHPDCAVIFIGPCAAKKQEILRPENANAIDVVLTFTEISEWLESENIKLENCLESNFDQFYTTGDARLFPVLGGMLRTGGIQNDGTRTDVLHISGAEDILELFSGNPDFDGKIIEPLFCKGGCIGGPCYGNEESIAAKQDLFTRRENVIRYAEAAAKTDKKFPERKILYQPNFVLSEQKQKEVTEDQIHKVLELTGKIDPKLQLNCGACGYKSCIENAVAVVRGMAEPEMCIPYMRRLAQQRTDRVIDTTPNGVVVLDGELCIVKMNPAFQSMFTCNNGILGRRISYLLNADGFEVLHSGSTDKYEAIQTKYGIKYHEILYALREENQYVGIYSDISRIKYDAGQLDTIKSQTLMHAREFLDHQVRFAQEMAHYLGKSTAQSEEIAKRLISLYEEESGEAK
jgi:iron only hydrogenase large subunit-like protein